MMMFLVSHQKTHHKEDAAGSGGHTLENFTVVTVGTIEASKHVAKICIISFTEVYGRYTGYGIRYTVHLICKQTHPCLDENHQLRYRSQHPALHAMKDPQVVFQLQVKSGESQNVSSRLRSRQTFSRVFLFFFNAAAWPCARAVEA